MAVPVNDKEGANVANVDEVAALATKAVVEYDVPVDANCKALEFKPFSHFCGSSLQKGVHHRAFWFSTLSFFVAFLGWFSWAPLLPIIRVQLGLCDNQPEIDRDRHVKCVCEGNCKDTIATAKSFVVGSTIFMRIILGTALERLGPVKTQTLLLLSGSLGLVILFFAYDIGLVYLAFAIIGIYGATFVTNQFWTTLNFAPSIVGLANATAGGWGNCGGGAAQLIGGVFQ